MKSGRVFRALGRATANVRSPSVVRRVTGTSRADEDATTTLLLLLLLLLSSPSSFIYLLKLFKNTAQIEDQRVIFVLSGMHRISERPQHRVELSSAAPSNHRPRTVTPQSVAAGAGSFPPTLVTPVEWKDLSVSVQSRSCAVCVSWNATKDQ